MTAHSFSDLLKKGDRVAVSNITGREASKVTYISQLYCNNIVAGWALGKGGQSISVPKKADIPVFGQFEELMTALPEGKKPNKIIVYSPPEAVYGDVKEVIQYGKKHVETIFVITEHVAVEVTAKLRRLCDLDGMDIIGCNTLGMINVHEHMRVGAVGGDTPDETFIPGSACIISNSGNMVNTIAAYLQSAGIGVSYGVSTGKDALILTPVKEFLAIAAKDRRTRLIVLYIEPGGTYEQDAIEWAQKNRFRKPLLVYVAGRFAENKTISLGHAGTVVEGKNTSASAKMVLFDEYFGLPVFDADERKSFAHKLAEKKRGVRVNTLHDLVPAAAALMTELNIKRDFTPKDLLTLKPWIANMGQFARKLPHDLVPRVQTIMEPYGSMMKKYVKSSLGRVPTRQPMCNASHASSNDGATPRVYGYSLLNLMKTGSFAESILLYWMGSRPRHSFETKLFEMCLTAALTNGPGTISAQGAKLSASAGNEPNTAMMGTLASIGMVHGGNGKKAAQLLIDVFGNTSLTEPYDKKQGMKLDRIVKNYVSDFKNKKTTAKDAGIDYEKIPCLGHPVFNTATVNYDPRERVIAAYLKENGIYNVFFDFYHRLSHELMTQQATNKVHAVNVDAALACVLTAIAWPLLKEKKISVKRAVDLPFLAFALGRVAGGAGEYLDHRENGSPMDMRAPVSECRFIGHIQD